MVEKLSFTLYLINCCEFFSVRLGFDVDLQRNQQFDFSRVVAGLGAYLKLAKVTLSAWHRLCLACVDSGKHSFYFTHFELVSGVFLDR